MNTETYSKQTHCVHAGTYFDEKTRGVNSPIFTSTSFDYIDLPEPVYPRYFNLPNQLAVEHKLAILEGGDASLIFSSGMAAICTALYTLLNQGDHVVFQNGLYGGMQYFIENELSKFGIEFSVTENPEIESFRQLIRPNTKLIYIETPSNPLLTITDIQAVAALSKSHGLLSMIDNTFASPINQNPIKLGIDIVAHSGTKYLGGHSDICCGALVASKALMDKFMKTARNIGGNLDANTCYLLERSIKTLSIRVKQQNENALQIAEALELNPLMDKVYYPGLKSHIGYEIAKKQMNGFGGMLSFELNSAISNPEVFLRALKLIKPAVSLGGVDSIISAPCRTSHAKMAEQDRLRIGIKQNLLRLSVGIEESADLIADIEQALFLASKK